MEIVRLIVYISIRYYTFTHILSLDAYPPHRYL